MIWSLLLALTIVSSGLLCRFVVGRARRYRQWLAKLLCFVLPPAIAWGTMSAADFYVDHYITCNAQDSGPEVMIALGAVGMSLLVAGLIGAIAGVLWGYSLGSGDAPGV